MRGHERRLNELVEPAVRVLGYELLGVQLLKRGSAATLRVYIDSEAGVTVDDCARVSHQVSGVLDVEDPLPGKYTLEVSSPGLDRPLFSPRHFEQHAGAKVRVKLQAPLEGRKSITGVLKGMRGPRVCIEEYGSEWLVPLESISVARLVPEL